MLSASRKKSAETNAEGRFTVRQFQRKTTYNHRDAVLALETMEDLLSSSSSSSSSSSTN